MDTFDHFTDNVESPARHCAAITPSDTAELAATSKALYVGVAGDVTLRAIGDTVDCRFVAVPAGTILPVRAAFVRATGTSATGIVSLA